MRVVSLWAIQRKIQNVTFGPCLMINFRGTLSELNIKTELITQVNIENNKLSLK